MNAESRTLDLVRRNPKLKDELLVLAGNLQIPELPRFGLTSDDFAAFLERRTTSTAFEIMSSPDTPPRKALEAIVRRYGRPVLLVREGTYELPNLPSVREQLVPHRSRIEHAIKRVGRVEFLNHMMPWGGTGWLVEERVVITNRHVAELVAESDGRGGFRFRVSAAGVPFGARIDFREEYQITVGDEIPVKRIRYLARSDQADIALLEIDVDGELPDPLALLDSNVAAGQEIGIIGYPAHDSRNDPEDVARYFGDVFDVKRFAPGEVTQPAGEQSFLMHDATTLGGNSGSVVLDLASGRVVGLHFAGSYLVGNYAVTVDQIKRALRGLRVTVTVPDGLASTTERRDGFHDPVHFKGRVGYDQVFLGDDHLRIPLLGLGRWLEDAAEATEHDGTKTKLLVYTHFSIAFLASRKMPLFTAVNIDGNKTRRIKRGADQWFADLRLPRNIQLAQQDYDHPDIDRGHMVRREDPNWGTSAIALRGNNDTFHYTNAAPQHARLNQGKAQWLGLEEYVLENAKTHGLRISVFTGPILRSDDRELENGVKIPEEFWKVVVAIDEETGRLRATGYVLSQGRLIEEITEGFVYGQYRSYQVPISVIADVTHLDFGILVAADPLKREAFAEAMPGMPPVIALDRLEQMVL